jgi:arabinose-5-phosphate isomerase
MAARSRHIQTGSKESKLMDDATQQKSARSSAHDKVVEILRLEAAAIEKCAENVSADSIRDAVEILRGCSGKVIIFGIGKSGVIAQKIAQTMTSTGTAAVFVHPSDALHGSLGIICEGDAVIAISNSGETDEIILLLPALRRRNVPLIAIVGNLDSTLSSQADVTLDATVDREACPLDLAPTASTTVALALGDALAMTLMEEKGLTADDFAANHPAGRLGKRLTLTVADLMHDSPSVSSTSNWLEVVHSISQYGLGAVNVVDGKGELQGIITDGDLRRTIEKTSPSLLSDLTAGDMMTGGPITVPPDLLAYEALRLMEDRPSQISVLPVSDSEGRVVGLLRLHDIVRSGL